ncbi:endonuclease [Nocardiopsis sp. TSRI0078]|uniref:endonuclease/exonuclease/phosphatase family protein n=1 Tax=unclassified Nocardiopsis TaxID=2649073 RepID=UPI00093C6E27|nr:endonuclease/exonuclease/phosphatase family protein [Nocardiopsis sp. TSRI0078]OKI13646.1 endonuclease [Nocardiopsis sp. TSRI0078]
MRRDRLAVAVGTVLFLDALRVFLPSLITLFGRAGSTDPALMGAFALAWFLLPLPFVPLARRIGPAAPAAAAAMAAGRLALQATDGGGPQLYVSAATVGAGAVWLVCTAMASTSDGRLRGREVVVGVVAAIAATAVVHTLLGTTDLVWWPTPVAWGPVAAGAALLLLLLFGVRGADTEPAQPVPPRAWLVLGPLLFLTGLYTANPAVGRALAESPLGAAAVATGSVLSVALALRPRLLGRSRWVAPAVLLAALVWLALPGGTPPDASGVPSVAALVAGQCALAACAGWAVLPRPERASAALTGLAAASGLLLFVVLVFAFYSAYDLYVPNAYVPFAALVPLVFAVLPRTREAERAGGGREERGGRLRRRGLAVAAGAGALTLAATALYPPSQPPAPAADRPGDGLRVAAYNVRMGFGMDGRFSVPEQAEALRGLAPDAVVLSEVDRGWLLNGGHDGLAGLARGLGMNAYWGPADGPLWGDAVLTALPVTRQERHPLTPSGPTGAQALEVTVDWNGTEVTVVSTHVQPADYGFGEETSRRQLRDVAEVARGARERGGPVVVAGDLNIEPDDPAWSILTEHGMRDAFGGVRPFPTLPGQAGSDQQIDHVLHSADLVPSDPANPDVPHSDHRPVAVTLTPAD